MTDHTPEASIWHSPFLVYRHNDLVIAFQPVGLSGASGSINRCGVCAALVESACVAMHTRWHERNGI